MANALALPGLTTGQKSKIETAISAANSQKSRALARVREMQAAAPVKNGLQALGAIGSAFTAGATDGALAGMGVQLPMGIKPSQVTGVAAAVVAVVGAFTGQPTVTDIATPVAVGNLAPHAYGLGYGAIGKIQAAVNPT